MDDLFHQTISMPVVAGTHLSVISFQHIRVAVIIGSLFSRKLYDHWHVSTNSLDERCPECGGNIEDIPIEIGSPGGVDGKPKTIFRGDCISTDHALHFVRKLRR